MCKVHENRSLLSNTIESGVKVYTVGIDTETTLTCCIPNDANPPINTVQWIYRDSPVLGGVYRDGTRTLVINNVQFNDRGKYKCAVQHVVRNETSEQIDLKVIDPGIMYLLFFHLFYLLFHSHFFLSSLISFSFSLCV